jgi:tetratricopeptide (TPR) repeat protein
MIGEAREDRRGKDGRESRFRPFLSLLLLLGIFFFSSHSWAAAGVRGATHPDFGRLVFEWDDGVDYSAEVGGGRLVLRFSQPIIGNPQTLSSSVKDYVRAVSLSADRRIISIALTEEFDLHDHVQGLALVFDLRRRSKVVSAATPLPRPSAPVAAPAPAPASEKGMLNIRPGDHDGFSRFVFDWASPVDYQVNKQGEAVSIAFKRPAKIDLAALKGNLPIYVSDASVEPGTNLTVKLKVEDASRVRHFTSGPKVVLDILRPPGIEAPSVAEKRARLDARGAAKPAAPITSDPGMPTDLLALAKQRKAEKPDEKKSEPAPPTALGKAPAAPIEAKPGAPKPLDRKPGTNGDDKLVTPAGEEPQVQSLTTPGAKTTTTKLLEVDEEYDQYATGPNVAASVSFTWNQPTAAAIFRRAGYLWAVFDRYQEVDTRLLRKLGGEILLSVEQMPDKKFTVVRMTTLPGFNPSMRRENLLWVLDFSKQPLRAAAPLDVRAVTEGVPTARIIIPVTEAGSPIQVPDPEVGDVMTVVPMIPLGHGVTPGYEYSEVEIPLSAQGFAIFKKADGIDVRLTKTNVEIFNPLTSLKVSREIDKLAALSKMGVAAVTAGTKLIDFEGWMRGGEDKFKEVQGELITTSGMLPSNQRNLARLNVARHMFANGYAAESLGVVRSIVDADSSAADSAPLRALRGAANLMIGRVSEAIEDLSHPVINNEASVMPFKAAALTQVGDPTFQAPALRDAAALIKTMPKVYRNRFGIMAGEAMIAGADDASAKALISQLEGDSPNALDGAGINYLKGRLAESTKNIDEAVKSWQAAEASTSRLYRAKSAILRSELQFKNEKITRPQLIEELERLRFAWRGDEFEYNLLKKLGNLYFEDNDYGNGLRILRGTIIGFRGQKDIDKVTLSMIDAFTKLYLEDEASKISPITAIALYDEFRELTPAGERGDKMIRKVAEILASVDLLERATEILQQQIQFRVTGMEKVRVGTRLAQMHLLNRQPDKALAAIKSTTIPGIDDELAAQRFHLEAQALADMDRIDEAIKLLDSVPTRDNQLLKAEIWWKKKNWAEVAAVFENLIAKPKKGDELTDQDSRFVLNWASALILAGDDKGLAKLRRGFGQTMEKGPYRDAYTLLTREPGEEAINNMIVAGKIKEVEKFQNFMASFRDRLRTEKLGATN